MGASPSRAGMRILACGLLTGFIGCADAPDEEIEVCVDHSAFESARAKPYRDRLARCTALIQLSADLCSVCDRAHALGDSSCLVLDELDDSHEVTVNGMTLSVLFSGLSQVRGQLSQARRIAEDECAETTEPDRLEVSPLRIELVDGQELELEVTAHFGGFTRDFSPAYRGTRYESLLPSVARVNNRGIVTGGEQDGKTVVTVRRGTFEGQVEVTTRLPEPNTPPYVPELAPMVVGAGNEISVDASESYDPDGHPIRFHWAQLSGPSMGAFRSDAQMLVFKAPQATAAIELALTVTDYRGATATRKTYHRSLSVQHPPRATVHRGPNRARR